MQPLNPFLAAFFKSSLPAQCVPVHHHVLLVPTTEVLLTHRDIESSPSSSNGSGGSGSGGGGGSGFGGVGGGGGGSGAGGGHWFDVSAVVANEDFLASHVLRIPTGPGAGAGATAANGASGPGSGRGSAAAPNLREMRGKAKQYNTINGKSVVIKDNAVYSNKGMEGVPVCGPYNDRGHGVAKHYRPVKLQASSPLPSRSSSTMRYGIRTRLNRANG